MVVGMKKFITLIIAIYFLAVVYLANWIGFLVLVASIGIIFLSSRLLKIRTFVDFKLELKRYWGEALTAVIGSFLLPYIVYFESNGDFRLSLTFAVLAVPSTFQIGYLWLRGVNKVFSIIKSKVIGSKK